MSTGVTHTQGSVTNDTFTYDLAGQLKTAHYGWASPVRNVTYNWDDAGNRQNVVENTVQTDYTTNLYNQYTNVGVNAVSYVVPAPSPAPTPNQHRITSYKAMAYRYYGDTYLSSVTGGGSTYQLYYDALGRCVERKLTVPVNGVSTTTTNYYLYDGEHWVVEYKGDGSFYSNALYGLGIDEIIGRGVNGVAHYPLPDRNGNTAVVMTKMTNNTTGILEQYRYDAFGTPTIKNGAGTVVLTSSAIGNRFLFTGREYNSQFGFYEYRARAYHPGLGRFMSEDPKGFDAGDYNFYRYCGNDPWDDTDPMGLAGGGDQKEAGPPPPPRERRLNAFQSLVGEGAGAKFSMGMVNRSAKPAQQLSIDYNRDTSNGTLQLSEGDKTLLSSSVVVGGNDHPTPTGNFHAGSWEKDHTSKLYGRLSSTPWSKSWWGGNVFGPYQLHIRELESRGIYVHGTMGPGSNPWVGSNRLISPTSHGCVRMSNTDIMSLHSFLPRPQGIPITISSYGGE